MNVEAGPRAHQVLLGMGRVAGIPEQTSFSTFVINEKVSGVIFNYSALTMRCLANDATRFIY